MIGLPPNLFYGTNISACILIFKKCRETDDNIIFIDASKEFEKTKKKNKLLVRHIDKIIQTYRLRSEIKMFSHLVKLDDIERNNYMLNIPIYVDTFEEEKFIDIDEISDNIRDLEKERIKIQAQINQYTKELGIENIF